MKDKLQKENHGNEKCSLAKWSYPPNVVVTSLKIKIECT